MTITQFDTITLMDNQLRASLEKIKLLHIFNDLPPSHQKEYLKWIYEAKKPATKQNRILKTIEMIKAKD